MKMDGGKLVVEVLKEQGTKFVFGVPGGQTLFINNAIYDSDIRFVNTRHENTAAGAADAWGRATANPGVCLATTGPGATNLITGIGGALRDSSPMIVLICQNKAPDIGKGDAQEANHEALFSSICKAYIQVPHVSKIVWAMREAYRLAKTGKPGPVVVDFYRDALEEQESEYVFADPESYCVMPKIRPFKEDIIEVGKILAAKGKVAILSGNGVKYSGAGARVVELSRLLAAPVVTTFNGISGVSYEEETVFGPRSRHGSEFTRLILEEADTLLVLGSSLSAISTNRWSLKFNNIIQVDIIPEVIGRHYPVKFGLVGDIDQVLKEIIDLPVIEKLDNSDKIKWLSELKIKYKIWKDKVFSGAASDMDASPAHPAAIMLALSKILEEYSMFCVDAGNPGVWSHLLNYKKGMKYMKPVNFGNMGFALPAGIACKLAYPEKEVISMLGDGSLGMTLADLETAVRCNLPIIILLLNDSAFGNIKQEELYKFGDNRYTGVDFNPVDYVSVAKGLGCEAVEINKAGELEDAIKFARASAKICLIDIKIDDSISVWPEAF